MDVPESTESIDKGATRNYNNYVNFFYQETLRRKPYEPEAETE